MDTVARPLLRALLHASGHEEGGETEAMAAMGAMDGMDMGEHHHMDPASPPPACYHCFWGHVGPGIYLLWLAALLVGEALAARPRLLLKTAAGGPASSSSSTQAGGVSGAGGLASATAAAAAATGFVVRQSLVNKLRVWTNLVAGPLLALGEGLTHKSWHGGNVQHFTMYCIIALDGAVARQTLLRKAWPRALLGVWEAGSMAFIGFQMGSHFHGGPLISHMHAMMGPLLCVVGGILFVERVFRPSLHAATREALRLAAAVGMATVALHFGSIGPGFWLYGTSGFLGNSWAHAGEPPGHEDMMTVSTLDTLFFLAAFLAVGAAWGLATRRHRQGRHGHRSGNGGASALYQGQEEDEDEETEEDEELELIHRGHGHGHGGHNRRHGGYVELLAKRGGSVDGLAAAAAAAAAVGGLSGRKDSAAWSESGDGFNNGGGGGGDAGGRGRRQQGERIGDEEEAVVL